MSKGGGQQTSTVKNEPAKFIAPYLTQAASESQRLYNQGPQEFYQGSTFVPFSPESEVALQAQTQRALQGSPLTAAAQDQALKTIQGDYLGGSPALQQQLQAVQGQVNSNFAKGGGYRSSANQEVLSRELGKTVLSNYNTERDRQQQAIGGAGQLAGIDYADIAQLGQVGAAREDLFSRQLQDQLDRYNFAQNAPQSALEQYIGNTTTLGSGYNTQTTKQPTAGRNVLGSVLGVASLASGLGGLAGFGGFGLGQTIGGAASGSAFGPYLNFGSRALSGY